MMLYKKGQGLSIETIAIFVLSMLVVIVLFHIFTKPSNTISTQLSVFDSGKRYTSCVIQGGLTQTNGFCAISNLDKDGDCAPDSCDFCIFPQLGGGKTGIALEQARGSNQCDKDEDGMPDACDLNPTERTKNKCTVEVEKGKCISPSKMFIDNPIPCTKKPFTLVSVFA